MKLKWHTAKYDGAWSHLLKDNEPVGIIKPSTSGWEWAEIPRSRGFITNSALTFQPVLNVSSLEEAKAWAVAIVSTKG